MYWPSPGHLQSRTNRKQLYHNRLSQQEMLDILGECWPEHDFPVKYISTESILHDVKEGSDAITAKAGMETGRERARINYVCYVSGKLTNINNPETLNASELYPDCVYRTPRQMLSDPLFVFGKEA